MPAESRRPPDGPQEGPHHGSRPEPDQNPQHARVDRVDGAPGAPMAASLDELSTLLSVEIELLKFQTQQELRRTGHHALCLTAVLVAAGLGTALLSVGAALALAGPLSLPAALAVVGATWVLLAAAGWLEVRRRAARPLVELAAGATVGTRRGMLVLRRRLHWGG